MRDLAWLPHGLILILFSLLLGDVVAKQPVNVTPKWNRNTSGYDVLVDNDGRPRRLTWVEGRLKAWIRPEDVGCGASIDPNIILFTRSDLLPDRCTYHIDTSSKIKLVDRDTIRFGIVDPDYAGMYAMMDITLCYGDAVNGEGKSVIKQIPVCVYRSERHAYKSMSR